MRSRKSYLEKYFKTINQPKYIEAFSGKISKNGYITNVCSFIKLNPTDNLPLVDEQAEQNLELVAYTFTNDFTKLKEKLNPTILNSMQDVHKIDKDHSINIKIMKKIADIILPDVLEVRETEREFMGPVLYMENTKTKEYAFLLPQMRR